MNKKTLFWIITIILLFSVIFVMYRILNSKNRETALNESTQNSIDISEVSDDPVTDECIDEWEDYEKYINEKIEEVSNNMAEDDTHYILKDVLGYIEVYYLDEENQEYLYKKTTIPTSYLAQEDIDSLKNGIEVVGIEELNKRLEDFE